MQNSDSLFLVNLDDFSNFCGIDEAGRGPIAGPLVVAGVILQHPIDGLADSKKLSEKRRESLFEKIQKNSKYYIHTIEAAKIDEIGLSKALQESLLAIKDFFKVNDYLFDGNSTFGVSGITTMVKADTKVASVSAASILAKVSRDRVMVEQSKIYPEYGFEKHKGYGTKAHIEAISQNGYTPIHRRSFKIKLHKME
jgi:ribonuclease HII